MTSLLELHLVENLVENVCEFLIKSEQCITGDILPRRSRPGGVATPQRGVSVTGTFVTWDFDF